MNELPEAPVTMFTNYKRKDGFEVSLTIRGSLISEVASKLDTSIQAIINAGGTPVSRQKPAYAPKVVEYVEGRVCPLDGGKLIKPPEGTNRPIKCENNKYDFRTKTSSGCQFTEWPKSGYENDMARANKAAEVSPEDIPDDF